MIKHIVMWKLKDFSEGRSKADNMLIMKNMLEALNGKIPGLEKLEVGLGIGGSETSFDMVLYSEFQDEQALETYQNHPEHLIVREFVGKVREKREVVDYKA
jgi:hypothetical protein